MMIARSDREEAAASADFDHDTADRKAMAMIPERGSLKEQKRATVKRQAEGLNHA